MEEQQGVKIVRNEESKHVMHPAGRVSCRPKIANKNRMALETLKMPANIASSHVRTLVGIFPAMGDAATKDSSQRQLVCEGNTTSA